MKKLITLLLVSISSSLSISQTKIERLVFNEVNKYRVENDLSPLSWDDCSYKAAKNQTEYIDSTGDYSHTQKNETFSTPSKRLKFYGCNGYRYTENILLCYHLSNKNEEELAKQILSIWKNSPIHNKNLLMDSDKVETGSVSVTTNSACLLLQP